MKPYLTLTDDEWTLIAPILPIPKRGPKRPHDRIVCAAFLFARAAGVSLESLPIGFPDARFLRTTEARWRRDGTLARLFEIGAPVMARMDRQYHDHILKTVDAAVSPGSSEHHRPSIADDAALVVGAGRLNSGAMNSECIRPRRVVGSANKG